MRPYRKLVIVHGYLSTPRHHWYRNAKAAFTPYFDEITIPQMPDPRTPDPASWLQVLEDTVPAPDEKTFFIGHSRGCAAILRYLVAQNAERDVGGVAFVSGFVDPIAAIPQADGFVNQQFDYEKIGDRLRNKLVIYSSDDKVVPPQHSVRLSKLINSKLYCYHNCGHFTQNDGIKDFPQLKEVFLNNHLI
jgi:predicted alpha/beta hydrolase family esterase